MKKILHLALCLAMVMMLTLALFACKEDHSHEWGEWETVTAATCTEDGVAKRVCKLDSTHTEEKKLGKTGHSWDDGVITTKPTEDADGVKTFTCAKCGEKKTEGVAFGIMTYDEFMDAEIDDLVIVECYVQATQSWWDNKITVYAADGDGGYFLYEMACSEEDAAKLIPGAKIKVTGFKAEWSGEIEIVDATFEFVDAEPWVAKATDVTSLIGTDAIEAHQNKYVFFNDLTVKSVAYKGGERGDDIYLTVTYDGKDYDFCVERYLTGPDSEVYLAVEALEAGDIIDVFGFLYWYEGINPHITSVEVDDGVMSYYEYISADIEDAVVVECYVQATQSWWDNKITVYAADEDGAYFIYEMACSEADAAKLVPGAKIKVTGFKAEWSGEIEITDATFEFVEADPFVAESIDVTELLGTNALVLYQNSLVNFNKVTVKSLEYKNGERGDDVYLTVTYNGNDYAFCIERYLTGPDTEVYLAVEALEEGDVIDVTGFLYWYEGPNTHITAVTEHIWSYDEFVNTDLDEKVVVECYVQATQSWWDNKITVYAADEDGAYFLYELACSEEDAAKLVPGAKIKVTGFKAEWSGEIEIVDATFEFVEGETYVAEAVDLTDKLGTDELVDYQNCLAIFKGMTVKSVEYKGGERGDDIYLTVTFDGKDYDFCIERYLTGPDTEVYLAVEALEAGDVIDVEAFLYWYNGPNPHITAVTVN